MHLEEQNVTIYKNENGYYSIRLARQDRNKQYFYGYIACQFRKGVEVKDKTKIHLKNAFLSFYLKDEKTCPYIMILDFEEEAPF